MWEEVLQTENIGSNDNFFERGGQSLLAVRVTSKLRETLGIELPVSRLFELQTVAGLAAWIDGMQSAGTSPSTADLLPTPTRVSRESVRRVADKGQAPTDAPVALPTANNPQLRTPTEQYIAAIWQEVLQTDNVAPEDNFFERGGQSLLAVKVSLRVREILNIELPVSKLFELQTVRRLSEWIDDLKNSPDPGQSNALTDIFALKRVSRDSVRRVATPTEEHSEGDP